jgi:hypothetical protein
MEQTLTGLLYPFQLLYGINASNDSLAILKKNPAYELSEDQLNSLGYDLLRSGKIVKTNTGLCKATILL